MKNNIRCKGNTNNTSVIIFFKKAKNSQRCYFLGRTSSEIFVLLLLFIFDLHFLLLYLHLSMFFILLLFFSFSFRRHPSPFHGLSPGFLHVILYFQPSPSQSDSQHFHLFNHSVLAASATAMSRTFFTHRRFLPCAPSPAF